MGIQDPSDRKRKELEPTRQTRSQAMYIAKVVRDQMEDFHCKYLSDAQMKELNPIIRNAICSALHALKNHDKYENAKIFVDEEFRSIPDYWEEPDIDPFLKRESDWDPQGLRSPKNP